MAFLQRSGRAHQASEAVRSRRTDRTEQNNHMHHEMHMERNVSVDLFKLVAVFGIILIHLAPSTASGEKLTNCFVTFTVPFFLVVSLYFFLQNLTGKAVPDVREFRLDRIIIPYVVWSIVYTIARALKLSVSHQSENLDLLHVALYGGAAVQLYFIPLLLSFQIEALGIDMARRKRLSAAGLAIAIGAFVFCVVGAKRNYFGFDRAPLNSLIYLALAAILHVTQRFALGRRINIVLGSVLAPLIIATACYGGPLHGVGAALGPMAGYGIAALALNIEIRSDRWWSSQIRNASFGLYLVHFGLIETLGLVNTNLHHGLIRYSLGSKMGFGLLIFSAGIVFVAIARRNAIFSYLFLGEKEPGRLEVQSSAT